MTTRRHAAGIIALWAYPDDAVSRACCAAALRLGDDDTLAHAYRLAARHPDMAGGDGEAMARLDAARELLLETRA